MRSLSGFNLRNRYFFALDLIAWCVTVVAALVLRTERLGAVVTYATPLSIYLIVATLVRFYTFRAFGMYARFWRYASVDELLLIVLAVSVATAILTILFAGIIPALNLLELNLPRSIPLIDGAFVLLTTGGLRFSVRLAERWRQTQSTRHGDLKRVVVFGAGDAGTMIVREMQRNPKLGFDPVAFLDIDTAKQGTWILGLPVEGDRHQLGEIIHKYGVQEAIIAIPSAPGKTVRELTRICQDHDLPVKTIPGWDEFLNARRALNQLRAVDITDLLRREPIQTDMSQIAQLLQGKRVLITGAGGSIGSEICRQVLYCAPAEMVLLGHGENSIFEIYHELNRHTPTASLAHLPATIRPRPAVIHPVIADVRDLTRLRAVFTRYQPQIVFHAAAHKHVPMMEANLEEAVTNNVLGTRNLVECALSSAVEHLVLISSDKAVNPTSVMGVTKRIAEMIVQDAAHQTDKNLVAVRFGNVLNSRGSVVPLFKQQIAQGGPITITHPEIRRYFMTIPEAVQLVLQTTVLCKAGAVYVLDMGEPIKIVDLAHDLIRLSGLEADEINIAFTGLRPGEKLYEELFVAGEAYTQTAHKKILVARNGAAHAADEATRHAAQIDALIAAAQASEHARVRELLHTLVPEYQPAQRDLTGF